jgi:hypothetical protein
MLQTGINHPMASQSSNDNAYTHKARLDLGNTSPSGCLFTLALLAIAVLVVVKIVLPVLGL